MRRKHLFMLSLIAVLLAAVGLRLARSRSLTFDPASGKTGSAHYQTLDGRSNLEQATNRNPRLAPPEPARRFRDLTPEQRVEQARKGHGPGG